VLLKWSLGYRDVVLEKKGPTPSQGAKSSGHRMIQGNTAQAIYDGRWVAGGIFSTIAPPIHIFHPIFDDFICSLNDPTVQPTADDLKVTISLMRSVSEIKPEKVYAEAILEQFNAILGVNIGQRRKLPSGAIPDGTVTLEVQFGPDKSTTIPCLLLELKRDLGVGDPSTQVALYMRHAWINDSVGYNHFNLDLMSDS
jgi:hypothetical protein